jgi:uncharacterized membrane protein YedE/YeeE
MSLSTILPPLIGGGLIGLSATLLLLIHGRVAGISGICGGILAPTSEDFSWRLAFVVGLVGTGVVAFSQLPDAFEFGVNRSLISVGVAGLMVGLGTTIGAGCTSGHGVCGISRMSMRSIVATCTFMATGALSVFVVNHMLGGAL